MVVLDGRLWDLLDAADSDVGIRLYVGMSLGVAGRRPNGPFEVGITEGLIGMDRRMVGALIEVRGRLLGVGTAVGRMVRVCRVAHGDGMKRG